MRRWLLLLVVLLSPLAHADERILDYHSDITVLADGGMNVTETIRVRAEGRQIKHGIYRDFPTEYHDAHGDDYRVGFNIIAVQCDGYAQNYHTKDLDNGIRIYIGNPNRYLPPGVHTYTLSYHTDRQLGFFADHDELYWNVTGNGWVFPIDAASATVHLPAALNGSRLAAEAYTGPFGSKGQDYTAKTGDAVAYFATTRALGAHEGLTIVTSWPKGYVHEPTEQEKLHFLLDDNRGLVVALGGLLLLAVYYLLIWYGVGRDPAAGIIIPEYEPPKDFAPAPTRYIRRMGYDHKTFATALVGLAVKKYLTIHNAHDSYTIRRSDRKPDTDLGPGESVLLEKLFSERKSVVLRQSNYSLIGAAIAAHKKALKSHYTKLYFRTNGLWLIPGLLLTVAIVIGSIIAIPNPARVADGGALMLIFLIWTVVVVVLAGKAWNAWRAVSIGGGYFAAVFSTLFALPFAAFDYVYFRTLLHSVSPWMLAALLSVILLNWLFHYLLKAPTRAGRRLLDKLEGFRLYLDVAEKDELQLKHPPEKTPELFEAYLPYALALGVEQHWAEKFAAMFALLKSQGQAYSPYWYDGHRFNPAYMSNFISDIGDNLSGAISSSSTAPGSSSGAGGGGSSGGGGGGGGGGGW